MIGIPKLIDPLSGFFIVKTNDFKRVKHKIKSEVIKFYCLYI